MARRLRRNISKSLPTASATTATDAEPPQAIDATQAGPFRNPAFDKSTSTGDDFSASLPKPSWPSSPKPQLFAFPLESTAMECPRPQATFIALNGTLNRTGVRCHTLLQFMRPVAWPHSFQPQPLTKPLLSTTIVWAAPHETSIHSPPPGNEAIPGVPATLPSSSSSSTESLPSRPCSVQPQVHRAPAPSTSAEWCAPADKAPLSHGS
mmetsp:Transcript_15148/g.43111  ORF Transcript_15148/g.43111 Transcript_15148/m.43111 type:complete len:208 (+) Transcript_15148:1166-1789(+)